MRSFSDNLNEWFYKDTQNNKTPEQLAKELLHELAFQFPDEQGKTLLHYTANEFFEPENKHDLRLALINLLFEQKVDVNAIDNYGRTALHDLAIHLDATWCFINPAKTITELFFQNGAQFSLKDKDGKTPLDLALQRSNPNPILLKALIKFMLLEQPTLTQPNSITNQETAINYWNIYKNAINNLLEQKIPGTNYAVYKLFSKNLNWLASQCIPVHKELNKFKLKLEEIKNNFYEYNDLLLTNLEKLQKEIIRIKNSNIIIIKTDLIFQKNQVSLDEDIIREIFKYLPSTDIKNMHKAVHPAFFKPKNRFNPEQIDVETSCIPSCCCIS